ncbi:ABC transporter ATP-binding protein/permease [candidate division KSB1 bacterium]|nr:ABC transporter ATP-binding protein/permease [candidate division KSB1 bacterium]
MRSKIIKEVKVVRTLLPFLRPYPWAIPAIITLGVLSSLAEGIGISLFIPFLESLEKTNGHSNTGKWLIDFFGQLFNHVPPEHRLLVISVCIFASTLLGASLSYSYVVLFAWLDARIGHRMRSGIFEQLLTVGYRFLERSPSGKLLNALSTETWRTSEALSMLVRLIVTICMLVVYTILLLLISWQLTLLVTVAMCVISMIVRRLTHRVKNLSRRATRDNAMLANRMIEGIEGMKVIRSFGRESYEQERFDQSSQQVSKMFKNLGIIGEAVNPVYEILTAALLVYILFSTLQKPDNLAAILVFLFVLYRLQPKIKALDRDRVKLNSLAGPVEEITSLLDRTDKSYLIPGRISHQGLKRAIRFERVTFRYSEAEKPALRNVVIRIPSGKTTALVGPSGAGKSTLIKLLLRFYEVTEGEIYVDEQPLRALNLASWRSRIALVSQDVFLFNASVRENIAYGRLEATAEEIITAAKQADAHEFISQLPEGYDTIVGERGVKLSGGQQQRLTLARAIVRNPEILILDEATNSLDSISEHLIQEALDNLSQDRTVIVIAHRLSTIKRADHIIVLDQGRVREQGDIRHVLELDGLFARLYELQNREVLTGEASYELSDYGSQI